MPYVYEYTGDDQALVVQSAEPRPDLLFWSYWREVPASEQKAAEPKPEPAPETVDEIKPADGPKPAAEPKPARATRKPRTPKAPE